MKFTDHPSIRDSQGHSRVRNGEVLVCDDYKPCIMCGEPSSFVEICSEGRFCSDECLEEFYEEFSREEKATAAKEGLTSKYTVFKRDTAEAISGCFVLRPDKDPVAIEALLKYAAVTPNYQLAQDIYNWVNGPELNPPLTEDDLAEMGGDGVYTTCSGWIPCWGIVKDPSSPMGRKIDCGEGRGHSLIGFNKTWRAYRRKPTEVRWEAHSES